MASMLLVASVGSLPLIACIALPLFLIRLRRIHLALFSSEAPPPGSDLQFTLRHMFLWTSAMAVLLAIGHFMHPLATMRGASLRSHGPPIVDMIVIMAVIVFCLASPALVAVWACLAVGKPAVRLLIAFFAALLIGVLPPYYFDGTGRDYAAWCATATLQLVIIATSLLIFRRLGYRLIRRPDGNREIEPARGAG